MIQISIYSRSTYEIAAACFVKPVIPCTISASQDCYSGSEMLQPADFIAIQPDIIGRRVVDLLVIFKCIIPLSLCDPIRPYAGVVIAVTSGCPDEQRGSHHLQREGDKSQVERPPH